MDLFLTQRNSHSKLNENTSKDYCSNRLNRKGKSITNIEMYLNSA